MQESGYRLGVSGCHKGLTDVTVKDGKRTLGTQTVEAEVCSDFGISQIYYKTAKGFGFDISRLLKELDYSVEAGAIVLADFQKRYSHKELDWWTRYNARSRAKRNIYKTLVTRYL